MAHIEWVRCKARELDDREDLVLLFAADGFGSLMYSNVKNCVYKISAGQWYLSHVITKE